MTFPCSTGLPPHPTCTLRQKTVPYCVGGIVYRRGCLVHQHTQYITLYGLDALDDWLPWTMNLMIIFWISSFGFPSKWKSKIMYVQTQPTAFFEAKHLFSFWGCTYSFILSFIKASPSFHQIWLNFPFFHWSITLLVSNRKSNHAFFFSLQFFLCQ